MLKYSKLVSIQNRILQHYFKILYMEMNFSKSQYKKEFLKFVTELRNKENTQKMLANFFQGKVNEM